MSFKLKIHEHFLFSLRPQIIAFPWGTVERKVYYCSHASHDIYVFLIEEWYFPYAFYDKKWLIALVNEQRNLKRVLKEPFIIFCYMSLSLLSMRLLLRCTFTYNIYAVGAHESTKECSYHNSNTTISWIEQHNLCLYSNITIHLHLIS